MVDLSTLALASSVPSGNARRAGPRAVTRAQTVRERERFARGVAALANARTA
jgi:hypothetical protein